MVPGEDIVFRNRVDLISRRGGQEMHMSGQALTYLLNMSSQDAKQSVSLELLNLLKTLFV